MVHAALPPLPDAHTGMDMIPLLLQGWSGPGLAADLSTYYTALLCGGETVVAVAVVRLLGADAAEMPVLAVRPDLQRNGLGRLMLASIERLCREAGVPALLMPCLLPSGVWLSLRRPHHVLIS